MEDRELAARRLVSRSQSRLCAFAKSVCGEEGIDWLDALPSLLEQAVTQWDLTDIEPNDHSGMSFVAFARAKGNPVVLKIGLPWKEALTEMTAAQLFSGHNCVRLIAVDDSLHMTLSERADGPAMWDLWRPDPVLDAELTEEAASFMAHFEYPTAAPGDHPTLQDWSKSLQRYLNSGTHFELDGRLFDPLVEAALTTFEKLFREAEPQILLHGDLHHGNILRHGDGWIAIDPKAVLGERAYEPSWFMRNPSGLANAPDLEGILRKRVEIFARILGLNGSRTARYAFANQVLSMAWDIEDSGSTSKEQFSLTEALNAMSGN